MLTFEILMRAFIVYTVGAVGKELAPSGTPRASCLQNQHVTNKFTFFGRPLKSWFKGSIPGRSSILQAAGRRGYSLYANHGLEHVSLWWEARWYPLNNKWP